MKRNYTRSLSRIFVIAFLSIIFTSSGFSQCIIPSGLKVSNIGEYSATFSWRPAIGTTSYELTVQNYQTQISLIITAVGVDDTIYTGGADVFCPGDSINWSVEAFCNSDAATSAGPGFSTPGPSCAPPVGENVVNVTTTSATLTWNSAPAGSSFDVQLENYEYGSFVDLGVVSDTFLNVTGLEVATYYQWQIATECSCGTSSYNYSNYFTTDYACANAPTNLSATNVTNYSATLSWNSAAGATSYTYEYTDNINCYSIYCDCYDVCNYISSGPYTTTDTSVTVKNLNPPSTPYDFYTWQVQTNCTAGTSTFVEAGFTAQANCDEPLFLTASNVTVTTATLNWQAASGGAISYNYRYSVNGTTWLTGSTTGTSAVITGLSPATAYEWEVQTNCSSGTSTFYSGINFTTLGEPCSTPAGTATGAITGSAVVLTWNADSGTSSYIIRYEVVGASTWTSATATTNSYTVTGLVAGQSYAWQVQSVCNGGGTSAFSASVNFTTACTIPQGTTTKYVTNNSATFSWAPSPGVTSYTVEYSVLGSNTSTTVTTSADSINVTGLSASTLYQWGVEAVCVNGTSGYTGPPIFSTTCGYPSVTSTAPGNNSAVISWSTITGATSYNIEYKLSTASTYTALGSTTGTSYNLTGLNANTQYDFEVQSVCSLGTSAWNIITFYTYEFPAPTGLTTTNITSSTATLKWNPVSGVTTYEIKFITPFTTYSYFPNADSFGVTGLVPGENYTWSVAAYNPNSSAYSSTVSFYPLCPQATGLSANNITANTVELAWNTPNGGAYGNFGLRYRPAGTNNWTVVSYIPAFYVNVGGLSSGTTYQWEVQSRCGNDDSSAYTSPATFNTLCAQPYPDGFTNITSTSVQLWWGWGSNVVPGNDTTRVLVGPQVGTTHQVFTVLGDSLVVTGLQAATEYYFDVEGRCSADTTYYSNGIRFNTLGTCSAPIGLSTTSITSQGATLKWSPVPGAQAYYVQYAPVGTNNWTNVETSLDSFVTSNGYYLTPGASYQWEVAAVCTSGGSSAFTSPVTFTTLGTCSAPTGLSTANITTGSATFKWVAVSGVTNYNVQYMVVGGSTWTSATTSVDSYNVTGLAASTNYEWEVQSVCSAGGTSAFTTVTNFTTLCTAVVPSVSIMAAPSATICTGTSVQFKATPTNGGTSPTYNWKLNGNSVQNGSSAIYTNASLHNGDSVACTMTSNAVCPSPTTATGSTIHITVNPIVTPTISITSSLPSKICTGELGTFRATATNAGSSPVYTWKIDGVTVQSGSSSVYSKLFESNTIYGNNFRISCVLTSSAPCASPTTATSDTILLTLQGKPVKPTIQGQSKGVCGGSTWKYTCNPIVGATQYLWAVPKGCTVDSGQFTTSVIVTFPANYDSAQIEVEAHNTCGNSAPAYLTVKCSTRAEDETETGEEEIPVTGDIKLNVYPNPNNGQMYIDLEQSEAAPVSYRVFNLMGQMVHEYSSVEPVASFQQSLDLGSQPSGIYFIQIRAGEAVLSRSIVVTK